MKKLFAALVISSVLLIGCQENSSILQPEPATETSLNKSAKGDQLNFDNINTFPGGDSLGTDGYRPSFPRL